MTVLDEPLRGQIPSPWFAALNGVERLRTWSNRLLPTPPATRLLGIRPAHVGPGLAVCVMPANEALIAPSGHIEISHLLTGALHAALTTAVGPAQHTKLLTSFANHFRLARPGAGNLLARARVVNATSLFAAADVLVEDNEGRQIAHGGGQGVILASDPAPPSAPSPLEQIEEPTWATPDPWQRPAGPNVPLSMWDAADGIDIIREVAAGTLPSSVGDLLGLRLSDVAPGHVTATMPASEWFCLDSRTVWVSLIAMLADMAGWLAGLTAVRAGETLVGLDNYMRFFRSVPADGRPLVADARHVGGNDELVVVTVTVRDADGQVVATSSASAAPLDNTRRRRPRRRAAERLLCTILFTDIVHSTARAEAMGDAAWRGLLERHDDAALREITLCDGRLVKKTGDGLLVRFASPARALECAIRMRRSLASLGIEIRAGLHTGECDVEANEIVGLAVHVAARIQEVAAPGEMLVSSTVKDLVSGGAHRFTSRGEHRLKGVEEPWRLWAVS